VKFIIYFFLLSTLKQVTLPEGRVVKGLLSLYLGDNITIEKTLF